MFEAASEDRRRVPVVLGGTQHDDRVSSVDAARIIEVSGSPDGDEGPGDQGHATGEHQRDDAQERVPPYEAHPSTLTTNVWPTLQSKQNSPTSFSSIALFPVSATSESSSALVPATAPIT